MRAMQILGVVLIAFGAYILAQGFSFKTKDKIIDLGSAEVTADKRHTIPPWGGAVIGAAGLLLVITGSSRRRA